MVHQIAALADAGVTEVILAINYQFEKIQEYLPEIEEKYNIKITLSKEDEPLGTGGPIRLAKDIILKDNSEGMFFVLNSDVICDFPFKKMIEFHKSHGGEGTLVTTPVKDPSKFGVILSDEKGMITDFVEKPQEYVGNEINAGIYLFNTSMIDRIENRPTSIERETFPKMAEDNQLYIVKLEGFWRDIGQPADFLIGAELYLNHLKLKDSPLLSSGKTFFSIYPNFLNLGANIKGPVMIHEDAKVSEDAVIGPNVSIGRGCIIEAGARIKNA